jgi:hypothetical protein
MASCVLKDWRLLMKTVPTASRIIKPRVRAIISSTRERPFWRENGGD